MKIKLLVTMRDISAAAHMSQVIQALRRDPRFEFHVIAQPPASHYLSEAGIAHERLELAPAMSPDSPEGHALRAAARERLDDWRPDAVLVGLSTPYDGGIDEAMLAEARVPAFLLQDFWGEQNRLFGKGADIFFALDQTAAARNRKRFGIESVVTGSARHAAYLGIDLPTLRRDKRAELGLAEDARVIGYFGQALNHLPGYRRTLLTFIRTIEALDAEFALLVRMHPRETADQVAGTRAAFETGRIPPVFVNEGTVDSCLAACDVVCSLFSNCTYDASYQNLYSPVPMSVPVSMLFDPEIAEYYRERVDFEDLPIHQHKLVIPVYRQDELKDVLATALSGEEKHEIWQRAKDFLPDPSTACDTILDTIAARLDGTTEA